MSTDVKGAISVVVPEDIYGFFSLHSEFRTPNLLDAVVGQRSSMIMFRLIRDYRPIHTAIICPPNATEGAVVRPDNFYKETVVELPSPFPILVIGNDGQVGSTKTRMGMKIVPLDPFGHKAKKTKFENTSSLTDPLKVTIGQSELRFYIFVLFLELVKDNWQLGRIVQTKNFDRNQLYPPAAAICQALKS